MQDWTEKSMKKGDSPESRARFYFAVHFVRLEFYFTAAAAAAKLM